MLSIVIPVYNSSNILPELVDRLYKVLPTCDSKFELILVNDGSSDHSWVLICSLCKEHKWIHGINLMRNYGQGNALLCGIRSARGDIIITMDDDLQHPPEEIPKLLDALTSEYDVVWGSPRRERHGFMRDLASRITKIVLQKAMGVQAAEYSGPFRAFRKDLRNGFLEYSSNYVSIDVLLTFSTTKFTYTVIQHNPRQHGVSNYTFRKLINHALNLVTGFSVVPLQFASVIGILFSLLGIALLIYILLRVLISGIVVPGFAFLASVIVVFAGAQLLALGIIGEYLSRMYVRTINRPIYVVRQTTNTFDKN